MQGFFQFEQFSQKILFEKWTHDSASRCHNVSYSLCSCIYARPGWFERIWSYVPSNSQASNKVHYTASLDRKRSSILLHKQVKQGTFELDFPSPCLSSYQVVLLVTVPGCDAYLLALNYFSIMCEFVKSKFPSLKSLFCLLIRSIALLVTVPGCNAYSIEPF